MLACASLGDKRRFGRLDTDDTDGRIGRLERAPNTGDGAAGAEGRDKKIDAAVRIAQDFAGGRCPPVGRVARGPL